MRIPWGARRRRDRGDPGGPARHRGAPNRFRRDPHRRHAGRRSAPAYLLRPGGPDRGRALARRRRCGSRARCRAWGSAPSCTATPSPWAWPASCATTPPGCSSRSQGARDRRGRAVPRWSREAPPPLAGWNAVDATTIAAGSQRGFVIVQSEARGAPAVPVSVDSATCEPSASRRWTTRANRRYRYPFTNCTNCGPRYTIVIAVPYDRPATTMAGVHDVRGVPAEYDDPADRRFHAQPNACPEAGPRFASAIPRARSISPRGTGRSAWPSRRSSAGTVVASRGLGGYHLAADAPKRCGPGRAPAPQGPRRQAVRRDGARPRGRGRDTVASMQRRRRVGPVLAAAADRRRSRPVGSRPVGRAVAPGLPETRAAALLHPTPPPAHGGRAAARSS